MKIEQLYAMNIHYRYYPLEYFFRQAGDNGFRYADIWLCPQHFLINYLEGEPVEKLRKLEKQYGVKVRCLTPEQNNPKPNNIAARDSLIKDMTERYFRRVIDLASDLECEKVLVTPGWNYYDETPETARRRSAWMLNRLLDYAADRGVGLTLESIWHASSQIGGTIGEIRELLELTGREELGLTMDLGALAAAGETVADWFAAFGSRIDHCHFVDGAPTGHLPWGRGKRDMEADLRACEENEYEGGFSMEYVAPVSFPNPEEEDRRTRELFLRALMALKGRDQARIENERGILK